MIKGEHWGTPHNATVRNKVKQRVRKRDTAKVRQEGKKRKKKEMRVLRKAFANRLQFFFSANHSEVGNILAKATALRVNPFPRYT